MQFVLVKVLVLEWCGELDNGIKVSRLKALYPWQRRVLRQKLSFGAKDGTEQGGSTPGEGNGNGGDPQQWMIHIPQKGSVKTTVSLRMSVFLIEYDGYIAKPPVGRSRGGRLQIKGASISELRNYRILFP